MGGLVVGGATAGVRLRGTYEVWVEVGLLVSLWRSQCRLMFNKTFMST